jgi:RNA polymerase sigma-70 factor, ECF subfamily
MTTEKLPCVRRSALLGVIDDRRRTTGGRVKVEGLFAAYRDGVFRYLCRIVGQNDATDLTQEVFLRVARSPVPGGTADGERAWVYRIARNLALNHRRDASRRPPTVELTDAARQAPQEKSAAITEAIARLSPLDRDVFLLREMAGLSYDEVAASCEISRAGVRSRLHRARQQLREALHPFLTDSSPGLVRFYDTR